MLDFFRTLASIAVFRRGPDAIPYSPSLLLFAVLAAVLVAWLSILPLELAFNLVLPRLLVASLIAAGATALLTRLFRVRERLLQTLTALFGAGAVIGLVDIPISMLEQSDTSAELVGYLILLRLGWELVVIGHILKSTLGIGQWAATGLALAIFILQLSTIVALFGNV